MSAVKNQDDKRANGTIDSNGARRVIDVHEITKRFGDKTVVNNISLAVNAGEIFGFLGPNGSGKTTFIRILCGLLRPDGGHGTCLGHDIMTESAAIKREVGYMTQRFSFYEDLSIRENLDFIAQIYNLPDRHQAVQESLERLGLVGRDRQLAGQLSGGWKQRLALAACLIHKPRLLLLDEPTAGVDPKARREFWDEIHMLAGEGLTVLITTHYMDEAERCHRLAYIAFGNLLTQGTAREIIGQTRLVTWHVSGPGLIEVAQQLRQLSAVQQVVAFGNDLHVSGEDGDLMQTQTAPWRRDPWIWEPSEPSLEDIFIHYTDQSIDNYGVKV